MIREYDRRSRGPRDEAAPLRIVRPGDASAGTCPRERLQPGPRVPGVVLPERGVRGPGGDRGGDRETRRVGAEAGSVMTTTSELRTEALRLAGLLAAGVAAGAVIYFILEWTL